MENLQNQAVSMNSPDTRRWKLLQVETAITCNLKCVMCPWKQVRKDPKNQGMLSEKIWESIRPLLPEIHSIDLAGGGEPLLQPKLLEWIQDAKLAGCYTGFLTNGLHLNEDLARELIHTRLDWICFSIDGATRDVYEKIRQGSDFDQVCDNLFNINRLRKDRIPKTMINFVLMLSNIHQAKEIVKLAGRLGVDQVNFKQCDIIRGVHGKNLGLFAIQENKQIRRMIKNFSKARRYARKLKVQTTAFSFLPDELPVCDQDPRNSMFIRYDGAIAPCINLAYSGPTTFFGKEVLMSSVHYGYLPDDNLLDAWQTDACRFYRDCFQQRIQAHDETILNSVIGAAGTNRDRILQVAKEAMPEAPDGCNVCHYLYNV